MPFSGASYDPEELAFLTDLFESVCAELRVPVNEEETRKMIAQQLMAAANDGKRDPQILREIARQAARNSPRD